MLGCLCGVLSAEGLRRGWRLSKARPLGPLWVRVFPYITWLAPLALAGLLTDFMLAENSRGPGRVDVVWRTSLSLLLRGQTLLFTCHNVRHSFI